MLWRSPSPFAHRKRWVWRILEPGGAATRGAVRWQHAAIEDLTFMACSLKRWFRLRLVCPLLTNMLLSPLTGKFYFLFLCLFYCRPLVFYVYLSWIKIAQLFLSACVLCYLLSAVFLCVFTQYDVPTSRLVHPFANEQSRTLGNGTQKHTSLNKRSSHEMQTTTEGNTIVSKLQIKVPPYVPARKTIQIQIQRKYKGKPQAIVQRNVVGSSGCSRIARRCDVRCDVPTAMAVCIPG